MAEAAVDWLVECGVCSAAALVQAEALAAENGDRVARALTKLGFVSEGRLARAFADHAGLELVRQQDLPETGLPAHPFALGFLRSRWAAPIACDDSAMTVAVADPTDDELTRGLAFATPKPVRRVVATYSAIEAFLQLAAPEGAFSSVRGLFRLPSQSYWESYC